VWLHEYEANEAPDAVDVYLDWREADLRGRYKTAMNDIEFGDRMALLEAPGTERIMRDGIAVNDANSDTAVAIQRCFEGDYETCRAAKRSMACVMILNWNFIQLSCKSTTYKSVDIFDAQVPVKK
jgi:hypothetical protein